MDTSLPTRSIGIRIKRIPKTHDAGEKKSELTLQMARICAIMISTLAVWQYGIGRMHRQEPFEAEATAAVSQAGYFTLQKLVNRALYGSPIRHYTIR